MSRRNTSPSQKPAADGPQSPPPPVARKPASLSQSAPPEAAPPRELRIPVGPLGPSLSVVERRTALEQICGEVRECRLCPVLVANRTQTVFGIGNPTPRLCFFGEAPGADEDAAGEPFVGRSGQLLNKMIEAMSLRREDVYILNVLKCHPPDNRNPLPEEAENCRPFFERQLQILRPEYICCLGASAAQTLLQTKLSIGKLRGRFFDYGPSKVLATYHPAYLLRNPPAKKDVWADLQLLMAQMGLERT